MNLCHSGMQESTRNFLLAHECQMSVVNAIAATKSEIALSYEETMTRQKWK